MAKKSSKTAHVLNLISKPKESFVPDAESTVAQSNPPIAEPSEQDEEAISTAIQQELERSYLLEETKDTLPTEASFMENTPPSDPSSPETDASFTPDDKQEDEPDTFISNEEHVPIAAQAAIAERIEEEPAPKFTPETVEQDSLQSPEDATASAGISTEPAEVQPSTEEEPPTQITCNMPSGSSSARCINHPISLQCNETYCCLNILEEVVKDRVDDFMQKLDMCTCVKCRLDVIAITLNNLTPKYTVTEAGQLFAQVNFYTSQYSVHISTEILKACMLVKDKPLH